MFLNSPVKVFSAISNSSLTSVGDELYENGIRIATQTDIDFLQQEINSLTPDNPNVWINSDGITSTINRIPFTDGTPNGTTTNQSLTFGIDPQNNPTLTVGGTQMISINNNMFLRSAGEIITQNDMILKGTADIQRSFQHGTNNNSNYVKTYVDKDNFNFITDNQIGSVTEFKGSSQYDFDNTIYVNGTELIPGNPNSLVADNPLVTPTTGAIILSDGINPFGTNTDNNLSYAVVASAPTLTVGNAKIVSANNNMVLETTDYILTKKDIYLQGTEDVQRYLTIGLNNVVNNVKTSVNINTQDYICDNQIASKTQWKGASEYNFDNDVKIGTVGQSKKLFVNGVENVGVSAGLLRSINCNLIKPTTVYDVVWSNLTPQQQLEWKGLDPSYSSPTQSLTGNYWNFTKLSPSAAKVGWFIPVDLSSLTFQDLESFWCVVRFNNNLSISGEGSLFFSIYTSPATGPNFYRTRINYQNPSTPINQTGYFYKIHCQDTITTTTAGNSGRAQEVGQTKIKTNPCEVRPDLWHIPFNKVPALSGDTSAGYTNAPILAISLQTASNIHTFDFDVVSIGYLDKQYNLFYA
jgi:hypothetical protein